MQFSQAGSQCSGIQRLLYGVMRKNKNSDLQRSAAGQLGSLFLL
jgi:hypothetical protein